MKRWPALFVLFALLAGAAFFSWRQGRLVYQSWLGYQPPTALGLRAQPGAPPALTGRVVLVIVGGLRTDASLELPSLSLLRQKGAWRTLSLPVPTYAPSSWATLLTGTAPAEHGVLSPETGVTPLVPTLFDQAKAASLTTALAAPRSWSRLAPRSVDLDLLVDPAAPEAEQASLQQADTAVQAKANLTVIYLSGPERAALMVGGGNRPYLNAASKADGELAHLLGSIDLGETTVLVTSDHGVTAAGGSGGAEPEVRQVPLVAAGKGVRPGHFPDGRGEDLAPTLAALLGLAPSPGAAGQPLTDMLAYTSPAEAATVSRLAALARASLLSAAIQGVGGSLVLPPSPGNSAAEVQSYRAEVDRQFALGGRHQWWLEIRSRLPWAAGGVLALFLYLLLLGRQPYGRSVFAGAAFYLVVYQALLLGPWPFGPFFRQHGFTYSLSQVGQAPYLAFIRQRLLEAGLAALGAALLTGTLAGRAARRGDSGRPIRPTVAVLHLSLAISALLGLQALTYWALFGPPFGLRLPPPAWTIKQVLDLLQVPAVAAISPLGALLGTVASRLARGRKEEAAP